MQLIRLLSTLKLPARLEAARRACAARFPLHEEEWTAWIQDSMNSIHDERDADRLLQLARRSLDDYLSVSLWQQYLVCVFDKLQLHTKSVEPALCLFALQVLTLLVCHFYITHHLCDLCDHFVLECTFSESQHYIPHNLLVQASQGYVDVRHESSCCEFINIFCPAPYLPLRPINFLCGTEHVVMTLAFVICACEGLQILRLLPFC
jgi:hypothetical protein